MLYAQKNSNENVLTNILLQMYIYGISTAVKLR